MKGTIESISVVLNKRQVVVLMHDLHNSLALTQSVLLKGHLISLFAEEEKTGTITYGW